VKLSSVSKQGPQNTPKIMKKNTASKLSTQEKERQNKENKENMRLKAE
jgi:hypothetical protein